MLVVGFHVPGWAGSLVGALVAIAWIEKKFQSPIEVAGDFNPNDQAYYLIGGVVLISIVGGLLCLIKPIRRGVGRFRSVGDPATRRGGLAATVTSVGLVGSSGLAALGGNSFRACCRCRQRAGAAPGTGFEWTALAIGAALVGRGQRLRPPRRGVRHAARKRCDHLADHLWPAKRLGHLLAVLAAGAMATGLIVTRLVETFGRPLSLDDGPDDWSDVGIASTTSWSTHPTTTAADTWSGLSAQPTSPATTTTSPWGAETDRWR